jgi:hypothetical protein
VTRTTIAVLAASGLAISGCGGSGTFANKPRPAQPVNVTVYIDNARVSVSPTTVGAGPIVFIVTNAASQAESLTVSPSGGPATPELASTGPINPQGTLELRVDFTSQGDYTVATGAKGSTQASLATTPVVQPATLHIGPPRPSSGNQLLQP